MFLNVGKQTFHISYVRIFQKVNDVFMWNLQHIFIWRRRYWQIFTSALVYLKNNLWPLFMDRVQLPEGCRATTRTQFTFYNYVPNSSWYSFDRSRQYERLSGPPVVFERGTLGLVILSSYLYHKSASLKK